MLAIFINMFLMFSRYLNNALRECELIRFRWPKVRGQHHRDLPKTHFLAISGWNDEVMTLDIQKVWGYMHRDVIIFWKKWPQLRNSDLTF